MTGVMNAMVMSQSGFLSGVHAQLAALSSSVTSSSFASPCRTCLRAARPSAIANERAAFSNVVAVKNVQKRSILSLSVLPNSLRRCIRCSAAEGPAPGAESVEGSTLETVRGVIADQLDIPVHQVEPHTKFVDLGADSLDTVEIMMILEERFGIEIEEEGSQKIATVKDAADLIEQIKASK